MSMPLVSIAVTTYNSAKFVKETLESVKDQTYRDIELIISDDGSNDTTVAQCREWLTINRDRFARVEIIEVPRNTGVSANCNRCITAARGKWIKFIAGDDVLLPNCVADNLRFVCGNAGVKVLFSQVKVYRNTFRMENFQYVVPETFPLNLMKETYTAADQHRLLLLSDRINFTPSYFFHKDAVLAVGGYDEDERLVEDYPMWLKLTSAGYRLYFMDVPTVGYRRHEAALNNKPARTLFNESFIRSEGVRRKYVYPNLPWEFAGRLKFMYRVASFFRALRMVRRNRVNEMLYRIASVYLNPFVYIISVRRRLSSSHAKEKFYDH